MTPTAIVALFPDVSVMRMVQLPDAIDVTVKAPEAIGLSAAIPSQPAVESVVDVVEATATVRV